MLKLNKNKGFCLVEVVISFSIITILFSYIYGVQIRNRNLKLYNQQVYISQEFLDGLKNLIILNCNYDCISKIVKDSKEKTLYINKKDINLNSLKNKKINEIITSIKINEMPYIQVRLKKVDEGVIKLEFNLNIKKLNQKRLIKMCLFKGDY